MDNESLQKLKLWLDNINLNPAYPNIIIFNRDIISVRNVIIRLSESIKNSEKFFSDELFQIKDFLLLGNGAINPSVFGRLYEIVSYLSYRRNSHDNDIWYTIHPQIRDISKSLYIDGHYANATENAFKEIIERLKNLFAKLKPNEKVPDGDSIITHVFSPNNPLLRFCDISTQNGENIQRGTMFLFQGAVAAFRNPQAHSNRESVSREEALQRLMFASLLMYKIDDAVDYSKITE